MPLFYNVIYSCAEDVQWYTYTPEQNLSKDSFSDNSDNLHTLLLYMYYGVIFPGRFSSAGCDCYVCRGFIERPISTLGLFVKQQSGGMRGWAASHYPVHSKKKHKPGIFAFLLLLKLA